MDSGLTALLAVTETSGRHNLEEGSFTGLTVSEGSLLSFLTPCAQAEHHCVKSMQ